MDATCAVVLETDELAGNFLFVSVFLWQDGSRVKLHRGVVVVVVVAVGVKHDQRARCTEKSCRVVVRAAQLLEHLHVLTRHGEVLERLQAVHRHDVLTCVEHFLHLLCGLLHLLHVQLPE